MKVITERNTTVRTEILAGFTTFAAMAYILAVNPDILSSTGMPKGALITATALLVIGGSLLMALLTHFPFTIGPSIGTATYFAYFLCGKLGFAWQEALSVVFWTGVIFFILIVSGIKKKIVDNISDSLKIGIQCGIGFFIAFVGLKSTGVIVANSNTLVGEGDILSPTVLLVLGSILLMGALTIRRFPGGILLAVVFSTVAGFWIHGLDGQPITHMPTAFVSIPHSVAPLFCQLDWFFPFRHFDKAFAPILSLLLLQMFDVLGALVALTRQAGFVHHGKIMHFSKALSVSALSTMLAGCLGTSTATNFMEASAGVESGGRTGWTAVTVAVLFTIALFFTPLIAIIPNEATAPVLILIGLFLLQGLRFLKFDDFSEAAPALFTMVMIPLTFSIAKGFSLGFLFYVGLKLLSGKRKQLTPITLILGALFIFYFILEAA